MYWYFKTSVPGKGQVEYYLGPSSSSLERTIAEHAAGRIDEVAETAEIERLCAMLRAGGVTLTDSPSARVIEALANAGVFRLGGVLVGTHAYVALGNMLGVRWERASRTQDIDIAAEASLEVALPALDSDVPSTLDRLGMGFLPVPGFNPREPSTSFKVRGRDLRVDLLTPSGAGHKTKPVLIKRLNVSATPLAYLDYLIEKPIDAALISASATLIKVPQPARFALHKLIVAGRRASVEQTKANKDREQAAEMLDFLAEERRGDIALALSQLLRKYPRIDARLKAQASRLPEGSGRTALLGAINK